MPTPGLFLTEIGDRLQWYDPLACKWVNSVVIKDEIDLEMAQSYVHGDAWRKFPQNRTVREVEGGVKVTATQIIANDRVTIDGLNESAVVVMVNEKGGWAKVRFDDGVAKVYKLGILAKVQTVRGVPAVAPADGDEEPASMSNAERAAKLRQRPVNEASALGPKPKVAIVSPGVTGERKAREKSVPDKQCRCGCGTFVRGMFAQGHDAKFKSWMKKIARGELDPTLIPKAARDLMVIKVIDGVPTPTRDYNGNPWRDTEA